MKHEHEHKDVEKKPSNNPEFNPTIEPSKANWPTDLRDNLSKLGANLEKLPDSAEKVESMKCYAAIVTDFEQRFKTEKKH